MNGMKCVTAACIFERNQGAYINWAPVGTQTQSRTTGAHLTYGALFCWRHHDSKRLEKRPTIVQHLVTWSSLASNYRIRISGHLQDSFTVWEWLIVPVRWTPWGQHAAIVSSGQPLKHPTNPRTPP